MLTKLFELGNVAPRERPWVLTQLVTALALVLNGVWWPNQAWAVYVLTLVGIGTWVKLLPWLARARTGRRWQDEV